MADRQNPPRRTGEHRQTSYREGGERRQPPREESERRTSAPRERRQAPPRRGDVIRCENCGEDYSITYKRCPFCDERPGRGGSAGKRVSNTRGGGYGQPVNPIQVAGLVVSLILIVSAMFIVFRFLGAPIFGGGKKPPEPGSSSTSQSNTDPSGSGVQPGGPDVSEPQIPDDNPPVEPPPADTSVPGTVVNAGNGLNVRSGPGTGNTKVGTLRNGEQVTVLGEENGWYHIRYSGDQEGYVSKEYVSTADAPVEPDSSGTVTGAGTGGLRVRSGPGTNHDRVDKLENGDKVTILDEENGWYHIQYGSGKEGYVSKQYISVG